jgi:hypothetical protein
MTLTTYDCRQRAIRHGPMTDTILPIPIRPNLTVHIQGIPSDLTPAEADKIAAVIMAFASNG